MDHAELPRAGGFSPDRSLTEEIYARLAPYLLESVVVVSAEGTVRAVLGPPGGSLGFGDIPGLHIFEYCLEQDVPHALELAVEALNSAPGWSTTWRTRLAKADGSAGDFEVYIENHQDDPVIDGFVLRLREIPPERAPDTPIFASELGAELESLAGAVPLPILFLGSNARLHFQNDAAREFCRELGDAVATDGLGALAVSADRAMLERHVSELLAESGERTVRVQAAPLGDRTVEVRLSSLGNGPRVLALVATLVDVTERAAEESELRRRASVDSLTGLLNRDELQVVLSARLARAPERVTVLYVDLDGFKSVNDSRGHDAGDDFLVAVGGILSASVRDGDVVGRLGGDEFVLVIDDDGTAADALAERISARIAEHADRAGLPVRASVGHATGRTGDVAREVVRRADHQMYEVKRTHRDAP